ncbi:DUF6292 family protein [Amycolatopsis sp. lyj-109]|uniref:DUF6292 family protein n=1 Tax=Amycolatopsis sp. lyj-109 TaxID=2789287 RepID=UPI003978AD4F
MEHPESDTRTLERGLAQYVRAVASAVGVPVESTTVEISDTATAYLGLPRRWLDRPDHDVMLVWSERRGWSLAVETEPTAAPEVIAHHGGEDLVPTPAVVARFVADAAAGQHLGPANPVAVTTATRTSLTRQLRPYLGSEPESPA